MLYPLVLKKSQNFLVLPASNITEGGKYASASIKTNKGAVTIKAPIGHYCAIRKDSNNNDQVVIDKVQAKEAIMRYYKGESTEKVSDAANSFIVSRLHEIPKTSPEKPAAFKLAAGRGNEVGGRG